LPERVDAVLDVACGTGTLLDMIRDAHPAVSTMGIDLSPDMLEKARTRNPESARTRWKQASAEAIPADDASFDLVTCTNAFHLVQDSRAALSEFRRVLRPAGSLIVVDWCLDYASMRLLAAWLRVADRQIRELRTLEQMNALLRSESFEIVHAERFRATRLWGLMAIGAKLT
jgi:ubiquinone/menaquinone biosynthesis C-methylase UbiE